MDWALALEQLVVKGILKAIEKIRQMREDELDELEASMKRRADEIEAEIGPLTGE